MQFKILETELKHAGFFTLKELTVEHDKFAANGKQIIKRELIEKGDAVALLPYDPDNDAVVLIEQFRIGALSDQKSAWLTELIAGMIEPGETKEDVVRREAQEEAGCNFSHLRLIHEYYVSPSSMPEIISLYCAKTNSRGIAGIYGLAIEQEDIRVKVVELQQALAMMNSGEIRSATAIIALQWLQNNWQALKHEWS